MLDPPSRTKEYVIAGIEMEPQCSDLDYLIFDPMINQIAAQEWKGSHIFEPSDIAQELWVWVLKNWAAVDGKDKDLQFFILRRAARMWCQQQRVEYMYATGAFLYTPKLVRGYLETSVFCEPELAADIEARVDVTKAYENCTTVQRASIYKRYALKEDLSATESRACTRAITGMTHYLNGELDLLVLPFEELEEA